MKTAKFKYTDKENGHNAVAKVTLKDDGKISITDVYFIGRSNYASKFRLKEYAKQIVALDFPSDMCYEFKSTESQSGLISKLIENTQDLKIQFLEKTKEWSIITYDRYAKMKKWTILDWCNYLNITPESINNQFKFPRGFYNTRDSKTYTNMMSQINSVVNLSQEQYTDKLVKNAEAHYNNSIIKLAVRLNDKGITEDSKISITNSKINENFECIITSDTTVVRAWTIIASGPIQQPHYRYLVK